MRKNSNLFRPFSPSSSSLLPTPTPASTPPSPAPPTSPPPSFPIPATPPPTPSASTSPSRPPPPSNAQGLALARVDLAAGGIVPPYAHPRASEVALLFKGDLLVGFVDTSYRLFTQQLRPGDAFVFPRGLVHFLYNLNPLAPAVAVAVAGLNSQNPGVQIMPPPAFQSDPRIPAEVLQKTFMISEQDIHRIPKNLGG